MSKQAFKQCQRAFRSGSTRTAAFRKQQIYQIYRLIDEHRGEIVAALAADGKCQAEANMADLDVTIRELKHTLESLEWWMRGESKSLELVFAASMDSASIYPVCRNFNNPIRTVAN